MVVMVCSNDTGFGAGTKDDDLEGAADDNLFVFLFEDSLTFVLEEVTKALVVDNELEVDDDSRGRPGGGVCCCCVWDEPREDHIEDTDARFRFLDALWSKSPKESGLVVLEDGHDATFGFCRIVAGVVAVVLVVGVELGVLVSMAVVLG